MLVAFLFITFLFDIDDIFIMHNSEEDDEMDGGVMRGVRTFSKIFTWLSLIFRPVVLIVLWKDSLDFMRIIRKQNVNNNEVQKVMDMHGMIELNRPNGQQQPVNFGLQPGGAGGAMPPQGFNNAYNQQNPGMGQIDFNQQQNMMGGMGQPRGF